MIVTELKWKVISEKELFKRFDVYRAMAGNKSMIVLFVDKDCDTLKLRNLLKYCADKAMAICLMNDT